MTVCVNNYTFHTFSATHHLLYLLCHSYKHFLHSGFGMRQLCDMILFMNAYGNQIDYQYFNQRLEQYHFMEFWGNLLDIAEHYLGFSYEKACYPRISIETDSELLLMDMLEGGVFGYSTMERKHSANMTLTALKGNSNSRVSGIFHSLFPDLTYMKQQFSYLKKMPYLLPIAYIQRIFSYGKQNSHSESLSSVKIGKQRVELLKKYKLIQ
jgi:hypothetical protein